MAGKLLIVESPGKLKTLKKILGAGWSVEASIGHTTELASDGPKRLGFEFRGGKVLARYVPRGDRGRQVLQRLKQVATKAEMVYLATDPDREGEAIAWHLVDQLGLKKYCRVAYTQITESAVKKALANPIGLNEALIASQRARQCLDKLVGFEVSPLLWNSTGGKSAGRVQSATLHLVCERERERLAFKPEQYWVLKSKYAQDAWSFEAVYEKTAAERSEAPAAGSAELNGDSPEANRVRTQEEADRVAAVARSNPHVVESCEQKNEFKSAPAPLITSSLQQVAGARFKFSPKHTMKIAQELYEGINGKGLITYMRTDAVALSPEFVEEARVWLRANAPQALPEKAPAYKVKADAHGAHEAIRPTSVELTPEKARAMLNADQLKLYTLIWERAVASQCKPARLSKTKITIRCADTTWIARGTMVLEPGYLVFWKNLESEKELPVVVKGQSLPFVDVNVSQQTTKAPPRYSEPRLVQLMERKGIGRPSTYASTISTLKDRQYVELENAVLAPTALGMATDEALSRAIPELVDTAFTAKMEESLDQIAEGRLGWQEYLIGWNQSYLEPAVVKAKGLLAGVMKVAAGATPGAQTARQGPHVKPPTPEAREKLDKGLAHARRNAAVPKCPKGHGDLVLRLSKKQTFYWKCLFPECDAMAWYQEFSIEKCPHCQARMEKIPSRKVTGGYFLKCAKRPAHAQDILMFRNRKTKEWEQADRKASVKPAQKKFEV